MTDFLSLQRELETRVLARTGRRVRGLDIELSTECVKLSGETKEYYVKQLAQQSVRELLPNVRLENAIIVN